MEAPQIGATLQDPVEQGVGETPLVGGERAPTSNVSLENVEGLTEKVGTLGLQVTRKNRCGASKKRARRVRLTEAPSGDSDGAQPRIAPGEPSQAVQKPGTSRVQQGESAESKGPKPGQGKRQRSTGSTPEGHAKRPKQGGQPSYARVAQDGIRVAVVSENYPESQLSKDNFIDIQQAIGRLVDELPEEGLIPRLVDSYWAKGAAVMVCHDEPTKDWLAARVPSLAA